MMIALIGIDQYYHRHHILSEMTNIPDRGATLFFTASSFMSLLSEARPARLIAELILNT